MGIQYAYRWSTKVAWHVQGCLLSWLLCYAFPPWTSRLKDEKVKDRERRLEGGWMGANPKFLSKWPLNQITLQTPKPTSEMPSSQLGTRCSPGWLENTAGHSPHRKTKSSTETSPKSKSEDLKHHSTKPSAHGEIIQANWWLDVVSKPSLTPQKPHARRGSKNGHPELHRAAWSW